MNLQDIPTPLLDQAIRDAESGRSRPSAGQLDAMRSERARRTAGPSAPAAPDNVESDLDAAATPMDLDPAMMPRAPRGYASATDEALVAPLSPEPGGGMGVRTSDLPAYGARYRQAVHRTIDRGVAARQEARQAGWTDLEPSEPPVDVNGPDMVTVDGVTFGAHPLSDGRAFGGMYTLGAQRRAQEAEAEARWLAGHRQLVEEDKAKYGDYKLRDKDPNLTPAQQAARDARKAGEDSREEQRQARRQHQIDHANDPLTPFEAEQKARRQRRSDMARLAGGSQNLHSGNQAFFQALAMLSPAEQKEAMQQMMPMDPVRGQVAAQQMANLNQFMRQFGTAGFGGIFQSDAQRRAEELAAAAAEQQLPAEERAQRHTKDEAVHPAEFSTVDEYVANHYSAPRGMFGNSSDFTIAEQQATVDHLVNDLGYHPAKAQRIVDEIARRRNASSWAGNSMRGAAAPD